MSTGSWQELIGKRCGKDDRLEIRRKLGEGGMGAVFEAVDAIEGKSYAIKFLHDTWANDEGLVRRFRHEGTRWKEIQHPNLIRIFGLGRQFGMLFVLSEFVNGQDLEKVLLAEKAMAPREALRIAREVASGLREVHRHQVVHRDLKPTNIILQEPDRTARILDFGAAKYISSNSMLTRPGQILGTAGYMAPEQIMGKGIDHRADIFALGALIYEMITGSYAFDGKDWKDILKATIKGRRDSQTDLVAAAGGRALVKLVDRMLDQSPKRRPQDMDEVLAALEEVAGDSGAEGGNGKRGFFGFLRRKPPPATTPE